MAKTNPVSFASEAYEGVRERYRPRFHFTPKTNWMNDPNGLVHAEDGYHVFYQHNPNASTWGDIVWGHATSDDLLLWQEHATSLAPEEVMAFSGSAIECSAEMIGQASDSGTALVAAYTGHNSANEDEDQRIAYSIDGGRTWRHIVDGPVIERRQRHFRDPRLFWHPETRSWIMAVALCLEHRIIFYGSRDLRHWEERGSFCSPDEPGTEWECPELVRLFDPVSSNRYLWMLKIDRSRGAVSGGSGGKYFLGTFDGHDFVERPEAGPVANRAPGGGNWLDYGKDFYAAQAFSERSSDCRPTWVGWVSNWQYARETPTQSWRGCLSIPRELSLGHSREGYALRQWPVSWLSRFRGHPNPLGPDIVSDRDSVRRKPWRTGLTFDLECTFDRWSASEFGLTLAKGANCETRLGFRPDEGTLYLDRRQSGDVAFSSHFPGVHEAPLTFDGPIDVRIIVDQSVIEVFVNGGRVVLTDLIFPDPDADTMNFFVRNGDVQVTSGQWWRLEVER